MHPARGTTAAAFLSPARPVGRPSAHALSAEGGPEGEARTKPDPTTLHLQAASSPGAAGAGALAAPRGSGGGGRRAGDPPLEGPGGRGRPAVAPLTLVTDPTTSVALGGGARSRWSGVQLAASSLG